MKTRWLTVKYMPDLRRREPVNLGVIAIVGKDVSARFMGENGPGKVHGGHVRAVSSIETYKAWVRHWRRLVERRATEGEFLKHRPDDNYFVEVGGERLFSEGSELDADEVVDDLFEKLVEKPPRDSLSVRVMADSVLAELGVIDRVKRNFELPLDEDDKVVFDYAFDNSAAHMMSCVSLSYRDDRSWDAVHAAAWGFARTKGRTLPSGLQVNGIALVKGRRADDELARQLALLSRQGTLVVELQDHKKAMHSLAAALHV